MTTKLSRHFTLEELTHSQIAARRGLDNTPPDTLRRNLSLLASTLEHVRTLLTAPVLISSGYRSPAVNRLIGGSKQSAHCACLAADFTAPRYGSPREIVRALAASDLQFDQLILEHDAWVHIGICSDASMSRRQVLVASRNMDGKTFYYSF